MNPLLPFTSGPKSVSVHADFWISAQGIELIFRVEDPLGLIVASLTPSALSHSQLQRADELWRTTCLEAFWSPPASTSYYELNLSPSRPAWNLYHFSDYRSPQPPTACFDFELVKTITSKTELRAQLQPKIPLPKAFEFSLCAVLQTAEGPSYFSTRHVAERADFHQRASLCLRAEWI